MITIDKILALTRQLYPTGRAWKLPFGGVFESIHIGLAQSEQRAYNDAVGIYNSILPDNANFTADDCTDWERRLGLIINSAVPVASRMLLIKNKLNYPNANLAKQNYQYLQEQLQSAGFPLYVYENRFSDGMGGYITKTPYEISGVNYLFAPQLGQRQLGQKQLNQGGYTNLVANSIDPNVDRLFVLGANLRSTIFIGGPTLGSIANIPKAQEQQLRQLILQIKPLQAVAFLLINYTP